MLTPPSSKRTQKYSNDRTTLTPINPTKVQRVNNIQQSNTSNTTTTTTEEGTKQEETLMPTTTSITRVKDSYLQANPLHQMVKKSVKVSKSTNSPDSENLTN